MSRCTIKALCELSGVSRQAYYKGKKARRCRAINADMVVDIVRSERAMNPRLGTRKLLVNLQSKLQKARLQVGRDGLFKILRERDMLVARKKGKPRTTNSEHTLPLFRNLLYHYTPTQPHQVWVSDITYIETGEGYLYLSLVTDRISRHIVGWNLGERLEASESVKALQKAIRQLPEHAYPIHHSDRGSQYCCREYVNVLQQRGLGVSMTENNHCYENSYAERVNGILKNEYNLDLRFRTKAQARAATAQAIYAYNHLRPHLALGMKKPMEVHRLAA